ncbi:MAG: LUD domain-containing protein [Candidatus Aminicenantia bacterium]
MIFKKNRKKEINHALLNNNLQQALERASHKFYENFKKSIKDIDWDKLKKKSRQIREKSINNLPQLIKNFSLEAQKAGAKIYFAETPKEALEQIGKILTQKKAKLVVKAKSMVSEEIELNAYLQKKGIQVIETDLGEWIIQLANERPSHLTAPVLHKTREEIAQILSKHLNQTVPPEPSKITEVARRVMRDYFLKADAGISGANLAIAESGTLVIISNEGNARLVTSLPPIHIALLSCEKFVETMEEASILIKTLTRAATGQKLTSYVSFITGPSRTADIEKEIVLGAHGPKELHIIILDNKRLKFINHPYLKEILYCLKCGGCMLVCPVYQVIGGHLFGGPVYPGGIGVLLTAVTLSYKKSYPYLNLCADCKKCEEFCPVKIPIGDLILNLKSEKGPTLLEKFGLFATEKKELFNFILKAFSWTKHRVFPVIKTEKSSFLNSTQQSQRGTIYLFQGCLIKYFYPEIGKSAVEVLSSLGWKVVVPSEQVCCGAPSIHLGDRKVIKKFALKNLNSFEKYNPDFILTLCPTGNSILKEKYPQLIGQDRFPWGQKIFDFTEFIVTRCSLKELARRASYSELKKEKVFYHHSCHYAHHLGFKEEPVKLIKSLGYSVKKEEEPFTCCGFAGIFSFKNPEISEKIWQKKKNHILDTNPQIIATDCPGCILQIGSNLKEKYPSIKVIHTAQLLSNLKGSSHICVDKGFLP